MSWPLAYAQKLAERIAGELTQFCDKIEIAGSIRRRRPVVNDIDLVVLVKPGQERAFRDRVHRNTLPKIDGPQTLVVALPLPGRGPAGAEPASGIELQLDIWLASGGDRDLLRHTPGNWGTLFLCRTGSRQHNIFLCQRATARGLSWNPHHGIFGPVGWPSVPSGSHSVCLASETEEDIFRILDLPVIAPELRER
jgi:DNA polymerase/3'-5' exonuclease PolX